MNKAPTAFTRIAPLHPTVAAEFEIRRSALLADANVERPYVWIRGGVVGDGCATVAECEKSALAYLRSLPARP